MKNLPSLVVSAVTTFDGKALAKGAKEIGGLQKTVNNLAKTFGLTFGAAAMLGYGRNAAKAFAENEKSAKRLETVLKNIGLGFDTAKIESNLDEVSAKFGLQGEVLRDAFQSLITVTGSTTKAQDLLNLSLDVSAGSGQDLLTVNKDLAAAYVGNTRGLRKYDLGLAQSELKTLGFNDAVNLLTKNFAGAATAELETYAGKMRVLREAADNAQESIGTGLVTAFQILAGDGGIEGATDAMATFGETSRDVLIGTASLVDRLVTKLSGIGGTGKGRDLIGLIPILGGFLGRGGVIDKLAEEGRKVTNAGATPFGDTIRQAQDAAKNAKARAKAEAAAAKRQKELLALQKKSALADKNKLSLSKAAAVFDTNRISIAAALQATFDKDTRLRLEALMAIEDDNGDLALRKINELAALQKNADLAKLAGVKTISDTTLMAINDQLLAELGAINKSKMAEDDKEAARERAFSKYNAAIVAAGALAAKESYNERVQIQLTEIARLAALSDTASAALTLGKLRESAELSMIDRVALAQKRADDARMDALQAYILALNKVGTGAPAGVGGGVAGGLGGAPALLSQIDTLTALRETTGVGTGVNFLLKERIETLTDAITKPLANDSDERSRLTAMGLFNTSGGLSSNFDPGSFRMRENATYNLNFTTGVISQPDEFATLIQDTIQKLNRGGDPLTTAGIL